MVDVSFNAVTLTGLKRPSYAADTCDRPHADADAGDAGTLAWGVHIPTL